MSINIMISREFDYDAIAAETADYWVEVTQPQTLSLAQIAERNGFEAYYDADEPRYDVYVPAFAPAALSAEELTALKAIFDQPLAHQLIDQAVRLNIKISATEALGLGCGRYMLSRVVEAADDVSMNLAGGNFGAFWNALGLNTDNDDETCGSLSLDAVEKAANDNDLSYDHRLVRYASRLREVIAYGRRIGATELYWA